MTIVGTVKNGAILLPEGLNLPDGAEIMIELPESMEPPQAASELGRAILRFAGRFKDLPPDLAVNHDHYLYGAPKR